MCTLRLYDVIGIMCHRHIKLKSFSNITQPLHQEAVRGCSFLYTIANTKSVIMSEAFLVEVSMFTAQVCSIICLVNCQQFAASQTVYTMIGMHEKYKH